MLIVQYQVPSRRRDSSRYRFPGLGLRYTRGKLASSLPANVHDLVLSVVDQSNSFNNATAYAIFLRNTTEFTHTGISNTNSTATSTSSPASQSKSHAGAIAGGVVGGVVGLALLAGLLALLLVRRRRRARTAVNDQQQFGAPRGPTSPVGTEPKSPRRYYVRQRQILL